MTGRCERYLKTRSYQLFQTLWMVLIRTEEDQTCRECRDDGGVATLLHDGVDDWYSHAAEHRRKGPHSHIWDMRLRVAVADVLKFEVAVESYKPPRETV